MSVHLIPNTFRRPPKKKRVYKNRGYVSVTGETYDRLKAWADKRGISAGVAVELMLQQAVTK